MKFWQSSKGLFLLGFIVLLATNGFVLFGVASNRSGEPESVITLTERELQLPYESYFNDENSGLSLSIRFQTLGKKENSIDYYDTLSPFWLTAEKLKELGFKNKGDAFDKQTQKEVFLVLEYAGKSFDTLLARAEQTVQKAKEALLLNREDKNLSEAVKKAEEHLERQSEENTRLFAVDAGRDLKKLRQAYPDKRQYLIVKGIVELVHYGKNEGISGQIRGLSISNIHVPLHHKGVFDAFSHQGRRNAPHGITSPRYEVELAFGSRLEPWIVSVRKLEGKDKKDK